MEEETVRAIRDTNRNALFLNRKRQKDEETDVRRSLANLRITKSDIIAIANKLKSKSSISVSDLKLLQNALVDDSRNVEVVMSTNGALRGLVRELSGHDVSKQCAACSCLCNLSLDNAKTSCIIAKAAGAYLVAALDTMTMQLAVTCAWTIGNLAGSGASACDLLIAQGALAKLCDVMQGSRDIQEAAVYALTHAVYVLKDDMRPEHLHKIIQSISTMDLNLESCQLLFLLSCHEKFTPELLQGTCLQRIMEKFTQSIENYLKICKEQDDVSAQDSLKNSDLKCYDLVYLLRVLANLNCPEVYNELDNYFVSNNLMGNIKKLCEMTADKSLLWFLGNMYNCGSTKSFSLL